ncbi:MAG: pilus assembly protein [Deltaproteobacteria bacterium]|nr:pilus assembly protein [Deltaproteobacteria bacterium]
MKRIDHKPRSRTGQAAIEFIMVVVVVFFFLFFFLSTSIVLVVSNYMDYATFMAARTLKTGYSNPARQMALAESVFRSYVEKIGAIVKGTTLTQISVDPSDLNTAGLEASYRINRYFLPPVYLPGSEYNAILTLQSEAHLGRDPSMEECKNYFKNLTSRFGISISNELYWENMDDNGC